MALNIICSNYLSLLEFGFSTIALVPKELSAYSCFPRLSSDSLYSPVSVSHFEGSGLPCDLASFVDLRRVVDF